MAVALPGPKPWACFLRVAFGIVLLGITAALSVERAEAQAVDLGADVVIDRHTEYWKDGVRDQARPIRMEMTVLTYDPSWGGTWVLVDGVPGYIPTHGAELPIRPRDRVLVEGTVVPNRGFSPEQLKITFLERNAALDPIPAHARLKDFAALKGRLVTFEGTLDRRSTTDPDHLIMDVVAEGVRVHVYHWNRNPAAIELPDGAVLRLTGVYNPKHDGQTDALEVDLWVGRADEIEVVGNLDSDPRFLEPISAIEELSPFMTARNDAAHIVGVVHAYRPGRITVRDHSGQMVVQTLQRLPVQIGEIVEAVGMRFTGGADWLLRDALVRRAPSDLAEQLRERMAQPSPVIRLAEQILELNPEDAAKGHPVELVGVVIRSRPNSGVLFLRDTSGCVRVDISAADSPMLKNGTGIRLRGETMAGTFAPEVHGATVEHWGTALLPEARPITLEQAMTGSEQGERVEMRGCVTSVDAGPQWTRLHLSTASGEFAAILASEHDYRWLLGTVIAARGICQVTANERRQLTGIELWLSSGDDIQVEQQALSDPFTAPLRRIGSLRQFSRKSAINYWARVVGVVTHHLPGRLLFVQDGGSGLLILSSQDTPLEAGDIVEATGIPGFESERLVLRDAVYRKVGDGMEPGPAPLGGMRDIREDLEDVLARGVGTLVSVVVKQGEAGLLLEADDTIFGARLQLDLASGSAADWQPGSNLALTGVYEIIRDERRQPVNFRLRLRSPSDVAVLRPAPWWTPERGLLVAGGLCVCVLGGFSWATLLRRRVQRQTLQLREQFAREARLEARHRDVFEKASDFIFTTDASGRLTSCNPAGERISGYTQQQALQLRLSDLIATETDAGLLPSLHASQDGSVTFQTRLRRRDGSEIWTEISARWLHEEGEFAGLLGVARDISERKQVEEELKRARDAAESNTQAKSAFLANMSHEIRTPMNGVIGMSNLLLDTPLTPEQRSFAETIRISGESLLTVLNDILDFSKMEAGKLHLESLEFDLVTLLEETMDLVAERAAAKKLELAAVLPVDPPRKVRGDPGRIRQVLLNLLGNAIKFTAHGEVTLHLDSTTRDGRVQLRIEVVDTGIGLSKTERENLFQPFVQADSSTTRRFGGTGLGLAISRQIIDLMHGRIGVVSRPGGGCVFWIELSLEELPTAPAAPPAWADGLGVLLVDPNAHSRLAIVRALATWQVEVQAVADTAQALAEIERDGDLPSYGIVLIDSGLPEQDRSHLMGAITALGNRAPKCILLLPFGTRLDSAELQRGGFTSALKKPVRRHELLDALQRALGMEPARIARSSPADPVDPGPRLRVLVAEDNPVNQKLIMLQLGKLGHDADLVANGREAIQALRRQAYDLILMDCQMPEVDGYAATRLIRSDPRTAKTRIVALTANAMRGDRERCIEAGMDDYLSKPVRMEALVAALQPSLDEVRGRSRRS